MYVIKVDGDILYTPELMDDGYKVISPKLHMEVNTAGSLDFTLPPCNVKYDAVHKMKSIITVEQDGEEIFRGRVLEETTDFYKQKEIYCEGDMTFLLDSLQAPFTFEGTAVQLFTGLIAAHNAQMDASKRFVVGDVSGLDDETVIQIATTSFADTSSTVQALLMDVYGGYMRTRLADGVYYIDYISEYTHECTQKIEFGVNLLDIDSQIDATELCTVLVPLGAVMDKGESLTIAEVNNGILYIENEELISRYGRIYRTHTWDQVTDPAQLLELAQKYMQGITLSETLTLLAVDMHLIDGTVDKIRLGDKVHLSSPPHGIDLVSVCAALDIPLQNSGKSEYTFGLPKQTMADQAVSTSAQLDNMANSINDQHRWITETNTALKINVETINLIGHRTTQLEIDVDAAEEAITLKASQDSVDILEEKHTAVELRLDAAEDAIIAKADLILLDGYVKTTDLETSVLSVLEDANIDSIHAQSLAVDGNSSFHGTIDASGDIYSEGTVDATSVDTTNLTVAGSVANWKGGTFVTNLSVTQNKNNATVQLADGTTKWIQWVESVTITPTTAYINYMGKE